MRFTINDYLEAFNQKPNLSIQGLKIMGYGSWRGSYNEPCIFIEEDENNTITSNELIEVFERLTDGTVFHGWKGGEYTYHKDLPLNFEPSPKAWTDGDYDMLLMLKCPELFYLLKELEEQ